VERQSLQMPIDALNSLALLAKEINSLFETRAQ
jgi:hypothetical protein